MEEMMNNNVSDTGATPGSGERLIRQIKNVTQRRLAAEDKIRIVLEGFRKEISVSDLCRREKISPAVYYSWLKNFMEGGKARLKGETLRGATDDEVRRLKEENERLKALAGEQSLELRLFKKSLL